MERQRLLKLCNRSIDLRGKVPGECQAYQFGGRTHYLDDRGYLLAKQLLERFKGRYTVGVYEALLKGIKALTEKSVSQTNRTADNPILLRDKASIQYIPFNLEIQRKELRITYATPVEIMIEDVLYHGSTADITTSAIRIVMKRAFTLDKGDNLNVNFVDFAEKYDNKALASISYSVLSSTHDELRTELILTRNRHDDEELSAWFDQWCLKHSKPEYLDLDNALFNLSCQFYARFYAETLSKPVMWLNKTGEVFKFHMSELAEHHLQGFSEKDLILLERLPSSLFLNQAADFVVATNGNEIVTAERNNMSSLEKLFSWHSKETNSHVLLFSQQQPIFDSEHIDENIESLNQYRHGFGDDIKQQLVQLKSIISITDITQCCQHLPPIQAAGVELYEQPATSISQVRPDPFNFYIKRKEQRYLIRTEIKLHLNDQVFDVKTTNGSENGLAVELDGRVDVQPEKRVKIDFIRWQGLTKKVTLQDIPFIIRDVRFWQGKTFLHFERERRACPGSINTFFSDVIKLNKEKLTEDNEHLRISAESDLFNSLLTSHLSSIPIYMTMDEDSIRILQAVTSTQHNHAESKTAIWLALQNHVREISEQLKSVAEQKHQALLFGIYAYLDNKQQWQVKTDFSFDLSTEKNMFLNQAVLASKHYFYHCSLVPVKPTITTGQEDLYDALINLRSQSQHKVKQIRGVMHSIFAIGELTDISNILGVYFN
jgi:hypothetical protein